MKSILKNTAWAVILVIFLTLGISGAISAVRIQQSIHSTSNLESNQKQVRATGAMSTTIPGIVLSCVLARRATKSRCKRVFLDGGGFYRARMFFGGYGLVMLAFMAVYALVACSSGMLLGDMQNAFAVAALMFAPSPLAALNLPFTIKLAESTIAEPQDRHDFHRQHTSEKGFSSRAIMGITLCWIGIILTPALIGPILLILGVPLAHKGLIDFQNTEGKTSSLIVVTLTFAYIVAAIVTVILVVYFVAALVSGF